MNPSYYITPNSYLSNIIIKSFDHNSNILSNNRLNILLIEKGIGSAYINGQAVNFSAPTIICLNEKEIFSFAHTSKCSGTLIAFHPNQISENFNFDNIRSLEHIFSAEEIINAINLSIFVKRNHTYMGLVKISEPSIKSIHKIIDQLISYADYVDSSTILAHLVSYIERLVKTTTELSDVIIADTSFAVEDVLFYLHNNYKYKITIPELSRYFHINRTTLSDRFFVATGETIIAYLNKYRINLSAFMLRDSKLSISDVAEAVGFNDTAYFAKLFRKYMHHTPSGYRDRYQAFSQLHKMDEPKKD